VSSASCAIADPIVVPVEVEVEDVTLERVPLEPRLERKRDPRSEPPLPSPEEHLAAAVRERMTHDVGDAVPVEVGGEVDPDLGNGPTSPSSLSTVPPSRGVQRRRRT